jgi:hypothetical protein
VSEAGLLAVVGRDTSALGALLALAGLAVMWLVVPSRLAKSSRWLELAQHYRTAPRRDLEDDVPTWLRVNGVGYRAHVAALPEGLYISVWRPFRRGHSELLVPWGDLFLVGDERSYWTPGHWRRLVTAKLPEVGLAVPADTPGFEGRITTR